MHKNPIRFHFIIAAPKGTVKPLSKAVASMFKLFFYQIEQYNAKSENFREHWRWETGKPPLFLRVLLLY